MKISLDAMFIVFLSEKQLNEAHLMMQCTLEINNKKIDTHVMINCGITDYVFVSNSFAHSHRLFFTPLKTLKELITFDDRLITNDLIIHMSKVIMSINNHRKIFLLIIIKLNHYFIVLRIL